MFTVRMRNTALQSGRFIGSFATKEQAEEFAKEQAARGRFFVSYKVCEGTPARPGREIGEEQKGEK